MTPEEVVKQFDTVGSAMALVVGFAGRSEFIWRADSARWEKVAEAYEKGGRFVGMITLLPEFRTQVRVLPPYSEGAARPYLEKLARQLADQARRAEALRSKAPRARVN